MTRDEARVLLNCNREDFGGKEPGNVMIELRRVYGSASSDDRVAMNEVIREWLASDNDADRYDGAFLTSEFGILENLEAIQKARESAKGRTDPVAPYEVKRYDRVIDRLREA